MKTILEELPDSYLIFRLLDRRYGVTARRVREIVKLPELTPLAEAPGFVAGVVNLRGVVIPVVDLNMRLGTLPVSYDLSDLVVVVETETAVVGVIVNEILEVLEIGSGEVDNGHRFGVGVEGIACGKLLAGVARQGEELVALLDWRRLWCGKTEELIAGDGGEVSGGSGGGDPILVPQRRFCPEATLEEHRIFRERALSMRSALQTEGATGSMPLAVVSLHRELLGVELRLVTGFTQVRKVTPIPCCPEFISGNMNLRGDVVTVIDLTRVLEVAAAGRAELANAMVVNAGGVVAGVLIDDVIDVIQLDPGAILPAPVAIGGVRRELLHGAANYEERLLSIINLEKVLSSGELQVNEQV